MYTPSAFHETRIEVLHDLIRRHSFATLVSESPEGLQATHLPFILDAACGPQGMLRSHMARANPHWQVLSAEKESLVIFQGPHAYISPTWYAAKAVPTWNYAAVHCYGKVRLVEEPAAIRATLTKTVEANESALPRPWTIDRLPAEYVAQLCRAIVAFDMEISRIEGKWKFNQNRSREDRAGVIAALGADPATAPVAEIMRQQLAAEQNRPV